MKFVTTIAFAILISTGAIASDKHGGHEVEAGKFHVELVVKDKDLAFYVRDASDKEIGAKSVKASAHVLSGKEKATVELQPSGAALAGKAPFSIHKEAKVVVTFSVAGTKSEQARFSLGAKLDHKGHKH